MAASEKIVSPVGLPGRPVMEGGFNDRPPPSAPAKAERLRCKCGGEHFFVTRVDFTCTVCFKSYRD